MNTLLRSCNSPIFRFLIPQPLRYPQGKSHLPIPKSFTHLQNSIFFLLLAQGLLYLHCRCCLFRLNWWSSDGHSSPSSCPIQLSKLFSALHFLPATLGPSVIASVWPPAYRTRAIRHVIHILAFPTAQEPKITADCYREQSACQDRSKQQEAQSRDSGQCHQSYQTHAQDHRQGRYRCQC